MKTLTFDRETYLVEEFKTFPGTTMYLDINSPRTSILRVNRDYPNFEILHMIGNENPYIPYTEWLYNDDRYNWYATNTFYNVPEDSKNLELIQQLQEDYKLASNVYDPRNKYYWYEVNQRFNDWVEDDEILPVYSTTIKDAIRCLTTWMGTYDYNLCFDFSKKNFQVDLNTQLLFVNVIKGKI